MSRLEAAELVHLWERGAALHAVDRALLTLAAAEPGRTRDELARLPLGDRDALLLEVRRATLGDRLEAVEDCPRCDGRVEVDLSCAGAAAGPGAEPGHWTVRHGDVRLTLRTLDSLDAAAAAAAGEAGAEAARTVLLRRAVVAAERDGHELAVEELPAGAVAAVAAALAERDPRAELLLELECPSCGGAWTAALDVASFVWAELASRAQRVLGEVGALAAAFGWREADILALSEPRRAAYLALARA